MKCCTVNTTNIDAAKCDGIAPDSDVLIALNFDNTIHDKLRPLMTNGDRREEVNLQGVTGEKVVTVFLSDFIDRFEIIAAPTLCRWQEFTTSVPGTLVHSAFKLAHNKIKTLLVIVHGSKSESIESQLRTATQLAGIIEAEGNWEVIVALETTDGELHYAVVHLKQWEFKSVPVPHTVAKTVCRAVPHHDITTLEKALLKTIATFVALLCIYGLFSLII